MIERWMEIIKDKGIFDELKMYLHSSGAIRIKTVAKSDETISDFAPDLEPTSAGKVFDEDFDNAEDLKIALENEPYNYSNEDAEKIVNLVPDFSKDLNFFKN